LRFLTTFTPWYLFRRARCSISIGLVFDLVGFLSGWLVRFSIFLYPRVFISTILAWIASDECCCYGVVVLWGFGHSVLVVSSSRSSLLVVTWLFSSRFSLLDCLYSVIHSRSFFWLLLGCFFSVISSRTFLPSRLLSMVSRSSYLGYLLLSVLGFVSVGSSLLLSRLSLGRLLLVVSPRLSARRLFLVVSRLPIVDVLSWIFVRSYCCGVVATLCIWIFILGGCSWRFI
jgi:hypothetical protein